MIEAAFAQRIFVGELLGAPIALSDGIQLVIKAPCGHYTWADRRMCAVCGKKRTTAFCKRAQPTWKLRLRVEEAIERLVGT